MKLLQDDAGNSSLMRVLALPTAVIGWAGFGAGMVGMFLKLPDAAVGMSLSVAMVGFALGGKAAQKKFENGHAQVGG